jgi:dipicolinate synthase subunit A
VVIDLASAPGGTDFNAARELGLKAELAPGLPGIVAPVTAGRIIAELIVRHLTNHDGEEGYL